MLLSHRSHCQAFPGSRVCHSMFFHRFTVLASSPTLGPAYECNPVMCAGCMKECDPVSMQYGNLVSIRPYFCSFEDLESLVRRSRCQALLLHTVDRGRGHSLWCSPGPPGVQASGQHRATAQVLIVLRGAARLKLGLTACHPHLVGKFQRLPSLEPLAP